jgi:hypothetical protein
VSTFGSLHRHPDFPSRFVEPRNVDVWLPPDYVADAGKRLHIPLLFLLEGQTS